MKFESVLVTGGTGTFGQAFVRRLLEQRIAGRVCVFSRGEHRQAEMRRVLEDPAKVRWFIGDIRDRERLTRAMHGCDLVVHAAALKRVEVGEYNPGELVKTNVQGTQNALEAAIDAGVDRFITLSSDKACSPANAYGASKLMAEKLTLAANNARGREGPRFAATRYGNVAGSQGSVIPAWRGPGPHWMSHPDATRFWMHIDEAVDLVLWTAGMMEGGELVVPELPSYTLADLAEAMGLDPWIKYALGKGEKYHEAMIGEHELDGFVATGEFWVSKSKPVLSRDVLRKVPLTSDKARRLSVDELRQLLETV